MNDSPGENDTPKPETVITAETDPIEAAERHAPEADSAEAVEAVEAVDEVETQAPEAESVETVEVAESLVETPKPAAPEKPRRWLMVKATAVLASVAATNYVCYGAGPVVQIGASESALPGDPARLSLALALRDVEGQMKLAVARIDMKNHEMSVRQSVWNGYERERHLQVLWVWDFFRIQSHIALRVALPTDGAAISERWREMIDAVRGLEPGSRIDAEVQSACGNIMQQHILIDPAVEWVPGS